MPASTDLIAVAPSSRSTCRSCKQTIARGELRFGRAYQAEHGEAHRWHHLRCAAERQPDALRAVLVRFPVEIPGLEAVVEGTEVVASKPETQD